LYSASDLTKQTMRDPYEMYEVLGTYWKDLDDADTLKQHLFATQQTHADVYEYCENLRNALGVTSVQPFVTQGWVKLVLKETDLEQVGAVQYGAGYTYGQGLIYGQVDLRRSAFPTDLVDLGTVQDLVVHPNLIWDASLFYIQDGLLVFLKNPFDYFTPHLVDGKRELHLWGRNAKRDLKVPYYRYGSILGLNHSTDEAYVSTLSALWGALVNGPSLEALSRGMLSAVGLQYCEGAETVEQVASDADNLLVITDKRVYRFHPQASPLVEVGEKLIRGQNLVDTLVVSDLSGGWTGNQDLFARIGSLVLSPNMTGLAGEVAFPNQDEVWSYQVDDVRFTLIGAPDVVEEFWDRQHAAGNLAGLLGITSQASTQRVNPLRFLVENVLGANTVVIRVRPEHFRSGQIQYFARILPLLPSHTLYLFYQDLGSVSDELSLASLDLGATLNGATVATDLLGPDSGGPSYTDFTPMVTSS
jgi:hypothetical protein